MPGDSYGNGYHQAFEPDGMEDIGAEEKRCPQQAEGDNLRMERNDLPLSKASDVCSQVRMTHQPIVHAARTTIVAVCGEQHQWSGGQHRKKDADDAHY